MSKLLSERASLSQDVQDLLRAKSAEPEFCKTEELIREFFPEMLALNIYLQEDPDEEGITRVILEAVLPESMSERPLGDYLTPFYTELHQRLPNVTWPVCGLSIDFARDDQ